MTRETAIPYVAYVVDDSGAGRSLGDDPHAIVREGAPFRHRSVLVGWQCGFEPLFVAVHSYMDVRIDEDEAEDMAAEYLAEIGWFANGRTDADYVIE